MELSCTIKPFFVVIYHATMNWSRHVGCMVLRTTNLQNKLKLRPVPNVLENPPITLSSISPKIAYYSFFYSHTAPIILIVFFLPLLL